ncbi:MAG: transporter substrate-binding domain-containing protein [Brevinematales bacterium]
MKWFPWSFLALSLWFVSCQPMGLTEEEKAWIATHPVIRLAPDPDFPPFEFFDQWGRYQGIGTDFAREFARWSGIKIEVYRYKNWGEVLQALSNREVDMINCAIDTPARRGYVSFPAPYLEIPNVVVTRKNMPSGVPFESVLRAKTGMVRGYGMVDILGEKYPFFHPVLYPTLTEGLRALINGEIDYFLADLGTASYFLVEGGFYTLRIDQAFEPMNVSGFGVRSDWPILVRIIEKFQKGFSPSRKYEIIKKWVLFGERYFPRPVPLWVNWLIVIVLVGTSGAVVFLLRNLRLKEREYRIKEEQIYRELSQMAEVLPVVLDRLPIGAMMVEMDGTLSYVNDLFVKIFGKNETEIQNFYTFYQTFPAQTSDKKLFWEKWETIVTGQKPNPYIMLDYFLFRDALGNEHPCRVDIHRLGRKFLFTFVDYSEKDKAEKLSHYKQNQMLLAMKEKDLLFMELEHRVRNTLQLIRSFIRLHTDLAKRYKTQDLLVKLSLGIDLLTIIQNYTMEDLKLRLYNVKVPLLEFLRHVEEECELSIRSEIDGVDMNSQSMLALLFVVEEVIFLIWRYCREKCDFFLALKNQEEIILHINCTKPLLVTEEDMVVSRDFVKELSGKLVYDTSPAFFVEVRVDKKRIGDL